MTLKISVPASTRMIELTFGKIWRTMIRSGCTPIAIAASTYSFRRSASTRKRTRRAIPVQPRMPKMSVSPPTPGREKLLRQAPAIGIGVEDVRGDERRGERDEQDEREDNERRDRETVPPQPPPCDMEITLAPHRRARTLVPKRRNVGGLCLPHRV